MDTTRITDPITEHLPVAGAASLASAVADATAGLAEQIGHRVGDLDLSSTVGRTRRSIAGVVPWVSPGPSPWRRARRWLFVGLGVAAVAAGAVVWRRRAGQSGNAGTGRSVSRDDWSTHASNGDRSGDTSRRVAATTNA